MSSCYIKKIIILTALNLIAVLSLNRDRVVALDPHTSLTHYTYDAWTTKEGLPHDWVDSIIQTRDGYIWFGTSLGLVRFDGIRFKLFNKTNSPGLRGNNVIHLHEGRDQSLWLGTLGGGVTRLKDGVFTSYTTLEGIPHNHVGSVIEVKDGSVWISTEAGLARFKDGIWTRITPEEVPLGTVALWMTESPDGSLWASIRGRIFRFKDGKPVPFNLKDDGIDPNDSGPIHWDRQGTLWVSSSDQLRKFKDGITSSYKFKTGVMNFLDDKDGNLWICTSEPTLYRFTNGQFSSLTVADGLPNFPVSMVWEDHEGSIWIGFYGGGIGRLKDSNFKTYTIKEGLDSDYVEFLFEDQSGGLWIRNTRYINGRFTTYREVSYPVTEDKDGNLWFTGTGLKKLKDGKITSFNVPVHDVRAIYTDRNGLIWVGTTDGSIKLLKNNQLTSFPIKAGQPNSAVITILEDTEGSIWFGTSGGGLTRYKNGQFNTFTTKDGLSSDSIESLYSDAHGNLWIGTNGGGLNRLKNGKFTAYTTRQGLFDDVAFALLEDNYGNLWMGSEKGIYKVSIKDLDQLDQGKILNIKSEAYGRTDGMRNSSLVGHTQRAACKTRDGRLWFGTIKGLVVVDPNNIRVNQAPPPVYIEEVLINKQSIDPRFRTDVRPGDGDLSFSFAALSFLVPERVKFKYFLEGFDKEWREVGPLREARYTNIPPGEYTFRVLASNNDGIWNESGDSFSFYLRPHFYQTYWFYTLLGLGLLMIGLGIFKMRMMQLKAEFSSVLAERSRIARELHDTLLQDLVGLGMQLEAISSGLLNSPLTAKKYLDEIVTNVENTIAEARRSVWNLRSQALETGDLPTALSGVAKQLTKNTGIDVQFQVNGPFRPLPLHLENNILRIGQEAVTNAVKHARPSKIKIELEFDSQNVQLYVQDDGIGFIEDSGLHMNSGHLGLTSMRERAEEEGGQLSIHSIPGEGTEVFVTIPLKNK